MPAQPGRLLAVPRNLQSHVAIGALPEEGRTWRFFSALGAALRLLWLLHRLCYSSWTTCPPHDRPAAVVLLLHGLRLLHATCARCAACLLRRHLMVWEVRTKSKKFINVTLSLKGTING